MKEKGTLELRLAHEKAPATQTPSKGRGVQADDEKVGVVYVRGRHNKAEGSGRDPQAVERLDYFLAGK